MGRVANTEPTRR